MVLCPASVPRFEVGAARLLVAMRPPCACCGTRFTPQRRHQRYCSPRCRNTSRRRRQRQCGIAGSGVIEERLCLWCGTTFQPSRANQWHCSERCRALTAVMRFQNVRNLQNKLAHTLAELHQPHNNHCRYCHHPWPCPENQLLEKHRTTTKQDP